MWKLPNDSTKIIWFAEQKNRPNLSMLLFQQLSVFVCVCVVCFTNICKMPAFANVEFQHIYDIDSEFGFWHQMCLWTCNRGTNNVWCILLIVFLQGSKWCKKGLINKSVSMLIGFIGHNVERKPEINAINSKWWSNQCSKNVIFMSNKSIAHRKKTNHYQRNSNFGDKS